MYCVSGPEEILTGISLALFSSSDCLEVYRDHKLGRSVLPQADPEMWCLHCTDFRACDVCCCKQAAGKSCNVVAQRYLWIQILRRDMFCRGWTQGCSAFAKKKLWKDKLNRFCGTSWTFGVRFTFDPACHSPCNSFVLRMFILAIRCTLLCFCICIQCVKPALLFGNSWMLAQAIANNRGHTAVFWLILVMLVARPQPKAQGATIADSCG